MRWTVGLLSLSLILSCVPRVSDRAPAKAAGGAPDLSAEGEVDDSEGPTIEDSFNLSRRSCQGDGDGECFAVSRASPISIPDARTRCEAADLQCDDYGCAGSLDHEGHTVEVRCRFDSMTGPVFEARSLRGSGEDRGAYASGLLTGFRLFLTQLGRPPTVSLASAKAGGYASPSGGGGGVVHVRGYTRKDGTYVQPHTRSAPRRK